MSNSRGPSRSGPGRNKPSTGRSAGRGRTRSQGAGSRRPGSTRKPAAGPSAKQEPIEPTITRDEPKAVAARSRASLTTRAIALAVVLLILTISYASSLRAYINQRQDIAETKQQIATSQQKIEDLSDEISRWNDPNYVRTQARERLGWVMPGERGYRVVDANGKPVSGTNEITGSPAKPKPKKAWYDKMWGSVEAADKPNVAKQDEKPSDEPTITEKTKHR